MATADEPSVVETRASCAQNVPVGELVLVDVQKVPLHLPRNAACPSTLSCTYAFDLYDRLILSPKGLQDP